MEFHEVLQMGNRTQLAQIAAYTSTPIAKYTHTANKEVIISAVDVDTNTFTSVGHGLVNGNQIWPIMNHDAGNIFPINVYAGGLTYKNYLGYYVVGKTDDTFQLSLSSGGAAIDLTTNANMNLTKWHFETNAGETITISNLPNLEKCKVKIRGRGIWNDDYSYITPNSVPTGQLEWLSISATNYQTPSVALVGDISMDYDVEIDYTRFLTLKFKGQKIRSTSSTAATTTVLDKMFKSPNYNGSTITSIKFSAISLANGATIEVYKI